MKNRLIILLCCCSFIGCTNNVYKSYYKGEGANLYFVYPIKYNCKETKSKLTVDFTIDNNSDSVRVVFSLFTKKIMPINSISFIDTNRQITLESTQKLFYEKKNNLFEERFSAKIDLDQFFYMCKKTDMSILINGDCDCETNKKAKKHLAEFYNSVLITFDM